MKKYIKYVFCAFMLIAVVLLPSCSNSWQGYENENLEKYISFGEMGSIQYVYIDATDEQIDERISEMLLGISELNLTDKAYDDGMVATVNCICIADSETNEDLSLSDYVYTSEETNETVKEICSKLIGMKAGENYQITVVLPSGYKSLEKDTTAIYNVSVTAVKEYITPELNDETAAKLVSTVNTVEELRSYVGEQLKTELESEANSSAAYEVWTEYFESSSLLSIPYEPYMDYYNMLLYPYSRLADTQGVTIEEYVTKNCNMTYEEFESSLSSKAIEKLQYTILIRVTANKCGITYADTDIDAYAEKCIETSDGEFSSGDEYIEYFGEDSVTDDYLFDKIVEYYTVK